MKQSLVISHKSSVLIQKKLLFILVFILSTVHYSLFTFANADEFHSRAVVAIEASTGRILYAKNPNLKLPPASTTKLMTSIIAIEELNPANVVKISKHTCQVAPLKAGFKEGDEITVETLLYAALMKSANDAAVALAEAVAGSEENFVYLMNRKAEAIGLKDTKFINPHGLPGPDQHTTAFDLSVMLRYALRYPKLKEIIGTRETEVSTVKGNDLFLKNTNRLLWSDEGLIGGKTGYTRQARHCFVCAAEREKDTVIVAILGSPSRATLWKESENLIDKGFNILANREEPAINFTKADYEVNNVQKVAYKKSTKYHGKTSKAKKENLATGKRGKTVSSANKKGKMRKTAKGKKGKDYRVLEKNIYGSAG